MSRAPARPARRPPRRADPARSAEPPELSELAKLAGGSKKEAKATAKAAGGRRGGKDAQRRGARARSEEPGEAAAPIMLKRSAPLVLARRAVTRADLRDTAYGTEFELLCELLIAAAVMVAACEVAHGWFDTDIGLSNGTAFVTFTTLALWSAAVLFSIVGNFARSAYQDAVVVGALAFMGAMILLLGEDEWLDFGLGPAFDTIKGAYDAYAVELGMRVVARPPAQRPYLLAYVALATLAAFLAVGLYFPSLRLARSHVSAQQASQSATMSLILNGCMLAPALAVAAYIPAVSGALFAGLDEESARAARLCFENGRVTLVLATGALRALALPAHAQGFLDLADDFVAKMGSKESTRQHGARIAAADVRRRVAEVGAGLGGSLSQLLAPATLIFGLGALLKYRGGHGWVDWQNEQAAAGKLASASFFRAVVGCARARDPNPAPPHPPTAAGSSSGGRRSCTS